MYKIKDFSNQNLNTDLIGKFVDFVVKKLQIDEPFTVYFVDDKENGDKELGKTAMYNPETKSVYVYATKRHLKDMMRSCAHELMHHKQNIAGELGEITPDEAERQANEAGYILRQFEDGMKSRTLQEGIKVVLREREVGRYRGATDQKARVQPYDADWKLPDYGKYAKCLSHQRKHKDGRCYPKEFNKNFDMPVESWSLQDIINARKDLYKRVGNKIYTITEFDGEKPERRSVFSDVKNLAIRKLILDKNLLLNILVHMEIFRGARKPAKNYMKKFNDKLNDPKYICTMYGFKKHFGQKLSNKDMEVMTKQNCKHLIQKPKPKPPKQQRGPTTGWDVALMGEQTKEQYYCPSGQEKNPWTGKCEPAQVPGQSKPPEETVPAKMVHLPPGPYRPTGKIKYDKKGRPVTFVPAKDSEFQVYGKEVLDASYMIYKLDKEGKLRLGEKSGGQSLTIPKHLIDDLLKFAINPKRKETIKDVVTKATSIYSVAPLTRKSDRAIDDEDERRKAAVYMTLAVIGAVPLPYFWVADVLAASTLMTEWFKRQRGANVLDWNYISDKRFQEALLVSGFALGFTNWKVDMRNGLNWLRTVGDTERKMYQFTEKIVNSQSYKTTLDFMTNQGNRARRGANAVRSTVDDVAAEGGTYAQSMGKLYLNLIDDLKKISLTVAGDLAEKKAMVDRYIEIRKEVMFLLNENAKVSEIMTTIRRTKVHTLARGSRGVWKARTELGVVDALREQLMVLNRDFVKANLNTLRKEGAFGIKASDSVAEISRKLADDYIQQLKKNKTLYKRVIRRSEAVSGAAAKEVKERVVSEIAKDNPEAIEVLKRALAPGNKKSSQAVAEEMLRVSGWSDQATALKKTREFVYGKGENSLQSQAMKEFVENEAKALDRYFAGRANKALGAGRSQVRGAKAAKARAISRDFFFGTGVAKRALETYLTGNKTALLATEKIGQAFASAIQWASRGIIRTKKIASFVKWTSRFIVFKVHWPIITYLRYYRPYCGWTLAEFTEHVAAETLTFAGILNPINVDWVKTTADPIARSLEKTKRAKCARGMELKNALDSQGKKDWERAVQKSFVDMEALAKQEVHRLMTDPKVIQRMQELEKKLGEGAKAVETLTQQAEIAFQKCKKDPKGKNCDKVRDDILKGVIQIKKKLGDEVKQKTKEITGALEKNLTPEQKEIFNAGVAAGENALKSGGQVAAGAKSRLEKAAEEAADSKTGRALRKKAEEIGEAAKELALPKPPEGTQDVGAFEETKNLSLNDVLREHREKELNDKLNKLIKGMTE